MEILKVNSKINVLGDDGKTTSIPVERFAYELSEGSNTLSVKNGEQVASIGSVVRGIEITGTKATIENIRILLDALSPTSGSGGGGGDYVTPEQLIAALEPYQLEQDANDKFVPWFLGSDGQKHILLDNDALLMGKDKDGEGHSIGQVSKWEDHEHPICDLGSASAHLNLTSIDRPTIQIDGESGEEAESMAFLSDLSYDENGNIEIEEPKNPSLPVDLSQGKSIVSKLVDGRIVPVVAYIPNGWTGADQGSVLQLGNGSKPVLLNSQSGLYMGDGTKDGSQYIAGQRWCGDRFMLKTDLGGALENYVTFEQLSELFDQALPPQNQLVFKIPDTFFNPAMNGNTGTIPGVTFDLVQTLYTLYARGVNPVGSSACLSFNVTRLQISDSTIFFEYYFTKLENGVLNLYNVYVTGTSANVVTNVTLSLSYNPSSTETGKMFIGDLSQANTSISGVYDNFIITVARQSSSVSLYLRRVTGVEDIVVYTGFTEGSAYTPASTIRDSSATNIGLLNISALTNYSMYITTDTAFYELSIAALIDRTKVWCKIEKINVG